jgi:hypothetical protein
MGNDDRKDRPLASTKPWPTTTGHRFTAANQPFFLDFFFDFLSAFLDFFSAFFSAFFDFLPLAIVGSFGWVIPSSVIEVGSQHIPAREGASSASVHPVCEVLARDERRLTRPDGSATLELVTTSRASQAVGSRSVGPALLLGGAGILFSRTIVLITGHARTVLKRWVMALTVAEMMIDLATGLAAARWWRSGTPDDGRLALRAGAVATLLHASRVLVFVVGRTGPWVDFDVRPEHREGHRERWSWSGVVFAAVMSTLGLVGVAVTWRARRRSSGEV